MYLHSYMDIMTLVKVKGLLWATGNNRHIIIIIKVSTSLYVCAHMYVFMNECRSTWQKTFVKFYDTSLTCEYTKTGIYFGAVWYGWWWRCGLKGYDMRQKATLYVQKYPSQSTWCGCDGTTICFSIHQIWWQNRNHTNKHTMHFICRLVKFISCWMEARYT